MLYLAKIKNNMLYFMKQSPGKMVLEDNQHILVYNMMIVLIFHYFLLFLPMHTHPVPYKSAISSL